MPPAPVAPPSLRIEPFDATHDLRLMAALMAASDPWLTLGRSTAQCLALLHDDSKLRFAAFSADQCAGLLILNLHGAFVGYLQTVFVAPALRGHGVGSALVALAEARIFERHPNVFLCVSGFNTGAQRLYQRLGYHVVGELSDFLAVGQAEVLMRKSRGPIGGYQGAPAAVDAGSN
jgi:[ribosomal protein S18]-alanine N-acetyltransferase